MMINIITLSNCHGKRFLYYIEKILNKSCNICSCEYIYNRPYISADLTDAIKEKIRNADILILQKINGDVSLRPYIHHTVVKKLAKSDCKIVMIPYAVNINAYWPDSRISLENTQINKNLILNNWMDSIKSLEIKCNECSIKMHDVFLEDGKNRLYYRNPQDPTQLFFLKGAQKILDYCKINYEYDNEYFDNLIENDYDGHGFLSRPILPIVKEILELKFTEQTGDYICNIALGKKTYFKTVDYFKINADEINKDVKKYVKFLEDFGIHSINSL